MGRWTVLGDGKRHLERLRQEGEWEVELGVWGMGGNFGPANSRA